MLVLLIYYRESCMYAPIEEASSNSPQARPTLIVKYLTYPKWFIISSRQMNTNFLNRERFQNRGEV